MLQQFVARFGVAWQDRGMQNPELLNLEARLVISEARNHSIQSLVMSYLWSISVTELGGTPLDEYLDRGTKEYIALRLEKMAVDDPERAKLLKKALLSFDDKRN
jgi:hypothetical protein